MLLILRVDRPVDVPRSVRHAGRSSFGLQRSRQQRISSMWRRGSRPCMRRVCPSDPSTSAPSIPSLISALWCRCVFFDSHQRCVSNACDGSGLQGQGVGGSAREAVGRVRLEPSRYVHLNLRPHPSIDCRPELINWYHRSVDTFTYVQGPSVLSSLVCVLPTVGND